MNKRERRAALWTVVGSKDQRQQAERDRRKAGARDRCACGKIIHRNRGDARDHIARLLAQDETGVALSLAVYPCKLCHYWHVGHSARREVLAPA